MSFTLINSWAQEFDIESIYNKIKNNDTTVYIYMTALWCSPCLDKMPILDAYFVKTKQPYKLIYLFDVEMFSSKKLKQISP